MHNLSLFATSLVILSISAATAGAQARVALNEESHINSSLLSATIGAIIAKHCDAIVPRKLNAVMKAWQLKNYALRKGYSNEEIDAFLNSKTEQNRMKVAANRYLKAQGVIVDQPATYCVAGLEIGRAHV